MAVATAVALAGCGGSAKTPQPHPPPPTHKVAVSHAPQLGTSPSTEYIIFTRGNVFETAKGRVPRQLAGLTNILSGLINRYSWASGS